MTGISQTMYRNLTKGQWNGRRVKTLVTLQTSLASLPRGTICTIVNKRRGFTLRTDPCPTCGIQLFIGEVNPEHVELIRGKES